MARAALSRADLLRVLGHRAVAGMAEICGFRREREALTFSLTLPPDPQRIQPESIGTPEVSMPVMQAQARPPLQARLFQATLTELPSQARENGEALLPLSLAELLPAPDAALPPKAPLLRSALLWPALKRSLSKTVPGELDLSALVDQLARTQQWDRLPLLREQLWRAPLWVIWDCADRLTPYQSDYQALYRLLRRLRGQSELRLFTRYDDGAFKCWNSAQGQALNKLPKPSSGTTILLLSDLGALAASDWQEQRWLQRLRAAGAAVVSWLPSAPGQIHAELTALAQIHHLCAVGRLKAQRRGWRDSMQRTQQQAQLRERLLLLASCAVHITPELLRALRVLDPLLRHEPGAEALFWDAQVIGSAQRSRPLRAEYAPVYRAGFGTLPLALQQQVLQCFQAHHAVRGRTTLWLEQLLWHIHSNAQAQTPDSQAQALNARNALQHLSSAGAGRELEADISRFARDVCQGQLHDARWWLAEGGWAAQLLQRAAIEQPPAGLSAEHVLRALKPEQEHLCFLAQRGNALYLLLAGVPPDLSASLRLSANFVADQLVLELDAGPTNIKVTNKPQEILEPMQSLRLRTRRHQIDIAAVPRPAWAHEFGRDKGGVYVLGPRLGSRQFKRYVWPTERAAVGNPFFLEGETQQWIEIAYGKTTVRLGVDLAFGHFAELQIGKASQRFRYIEPGEFLMGSPETEAERDENEGPQHRVRITEAFWCADSACTQEFWMAVVVGKKPNRFKGDWRCPVENVTFSDVEGFISHLNSLLPPHCSAALPTEAQWEYACRAGTKSPFHFGTNITAEQVNFNGTKPYSNGKKGLNRGRAVRVKSLPPNAWGLFEMHGNVWEWCADDLREYRALDIGQAEIDPKGSFKFGTQVQRGGSWLTGASYARAADRQQSGRDFTYMGVGFRLTLRSSSLGTEAQT